jgi:imidazole glycerol-phosphate synthase subunit HisH
MSGARIVICDVGLGNLRSVERALARAAADAGRTVEIVRTTDPQVLRRADKIVVPGQGAFRDCTTALARGLGDAVKEAIVAGTPYLGICLGLQVLFESSAEAEGCAGLGLLRGKVEKLAGGLDPFTGAALKIPHMGWNRVEPLGGAMLGEAAAWFYFVHSYAVVPADPTVVVAMTDYGGPFVSAVEKDNVFACQFHPEKSQAAGLGVLGRFVGA